MSQMDRYNNRGKPKKSTPKKKKQPKKKAPPKHKGRTMTARRK